MVDDPPREVEDERRHQVVAQAKTPKMEKVKKHLPGGRVEEEVLISRLVYLEKGMWAFLTALAKAKKYPRTSRSIAFRAILERDPEYRRFARNARKRKGGQTA